MNYKIIVLRENCPEVLIIRFVANSPQEAIVRLEIESKNPSMSWHKLLLFAD